MIIMTLFGNKIILKLYFSIILLLIFSFNSTTALENKIVAKIENNIITSTDIEQEMIYLKILNKNLSELTDEEVYNISKSSLIRDQIKINELEKFVPGVLLNKQTTDKIIETTYKRLEFNSLNNFKEFLKIANLNLEYFEKKISIEILWNDLIYNKFSNKIKIDKIKIEKDIAEQNKSTSKNYLLSEIVFEIENKKNIDSLYNEIKKSIKEKGFENTALIYSISDSAKLGGKVGWIKEGSLSKEIQKNLLNLKKNELTKPIQIPSGFIILKLDDINILETKIDKEKELKKRVNTERNKQLRQLSNIYFKKIKNDVSIKEYE